jgi:hypothetical protein
VNWQSASQYKGLILKIAISWLSIALLASFLITMKSNANPITLSIIPEVPKTKEPVVATFSISNLTDKPATTSYQLYVNGKLVESGSMLVAQQSSSKHQYAYTNYLERGDQVNFILKAHSDTGNFLKVVSLPAYPPQLMSSFVSLAAFSTSVMSAMISMEYFNNAFGTTSGGLNTGVIIAIILSALLIFLELSQAATADKGITILGRYRISLGNMAAILFIIFLGMVFTRTVMILAT